MAEQTTLTEREEALLRKLAAKHRATTIDLHGYGTRIVDEYVLAFGRELMGILRERAIKRLEGMRDLTGERNPCIDYAVEALRNLDFGDPE